MAEFFHVLQTAAMDAFLAMLMTTVSAIVVDLAFHHLLTGFMAAPLC